MPAKTCTDYWLDRENMSFVGDFEGMYRDVADPWGCESESGGLDSRLFLELLFSDRGYGVILDIGSGLGGFTDQLNRRNGGGQIVGADVSETAVAKAKAKYSEIEFRALNILTDPIGGPYDLIVLSEVLWYLLDDLKGVFDKIDSALSKSHGRLGVKQYFPAVQRFGADKMRGLDGFETFLHQETGFRFTRKVVSHHPSDGIVLLAVFER